MASLERLPADQRAVLSLVLQRGRSFDEIAAMLSIDRAAVRQRALEGLDALGPQNGVDDLRRSLITDYLLGQLPGRVADQVRGSLAAQPAERAWARVVAAELAPIAARGLPEIPAASAATPSASASPSATAASASPSATAADPGSAPSAAEPRSASGRGAGAVSDRTSPPAAGPPSSRRGGAILLGVAALVVGVVAILLATGSSSKPSGHPSASAPPASQSASGTSPAAGLGTGTSALGTSGTGTATTPQPLHTIAMLSPSGIKDRQGAAAVVRASGRLGLVIAARGLAATSSSPPSAYAVWLKSAKTGASYLLGFYSQKVAASGAAKGALEAEVALPGNATSYDQLLLTLETRSRPTAPGPIVLEGAFAE